jgi:signal transduction histidine kinase
LRSSNSSPKALIRRGVRTRACRVETHLDTKFATNFLTAAALTVLFSINAYAVDPNRGMSQYIRDRWGPEKGFPSGPVYAITQTTGGYLWIGTEAGLVRFDGLTFDMVQNGRPSPFSIGQVLGLTAASDGWLWFRLRGLNLQRYRNGVFQDVMSDLHQPDAGVTVVIQPNDSELLFATRRRGILILRGSKLETLAPPESLPVSPVISLARTPDGDVWMGTRDTGLARLHQGRVTVVTDGLPDLKINCLLPVGRNELWIGTDGGVVRWNGTGIAKAGLYPSLDHVQALAMTSDRDGNVWVGTASNGLFRINSGGVSAVDERPGEAITAVFEDREGNIWTAHANGIERLRDSAFATYSTAEGLPSDNNGAIYSGDHDRIWFAPASGGLYSLHDGMVDATLTGCGAGGSACPTTADHQLRDQVGQALSPVGAFFRSLLKNDVVYSISGTGNDLWIGRQRGGLTHLRPDGAAQTYTQADGLAQNSVFAVARSRDGTVWSGTLNAGVSRFRDGRFTTYTAANGLASDTISSILEHSDGTMWFATPGGLSAFANNSWRTYAVRDGLPSDNVNCLFEDSTGALWIGTLGGLAFSRSGRIQVPPGTPPPLHEQIFGIAEDRSGWLWLTTANHVLRVKRDALERGVLGEGDLREYELADGLRSLAGVKRHRSVVADQSGRIWLSLTRGLSVVDPTRLAGRSVPALVHIQAISADGNAINLQDPVRVPARPQRITLDYAGLSLSIPERTRFRYTLDGFDHGWSGPVADRQAAYTNLGPGPYKFRVVASNLDQNFNSAEASISFQIEPVYWQTWWFRSLAILVIACAVAGYVALRLRRLTAQMSVRFEERLAERTRIAQELHDTLLQGFLSASMQLHVAADTLPADSAAKPALGRILDLMRRVTDEGRNALHDLRASSSASLDLEQAFSRIPQELAAGDEIVFRVMVQGRPRPLHPVIRDEVYRIGREALVNAFRHAKARRIEVELEYSSREFRVLLRDDGCGIDPSILETGREGHWGLSGMRERAERIGARLRVRSHPGSGTQVELSIPGNVAFTRKAKWSKNLE